MASAFTVSRTHLIYALCLPLAVLIGYFLAEPLESSSLAMIFFVFAVLLFPLIVRWYHPLLIVTWNAVVNPYFLPGRPYLWMLLAFIGILVAIVSRSVDERHRFLPGGQISASLLFLAAVMMVTAATTGGIGLRVLGSETHGGRNYFYAGMAIIGYFALVSQRIPPKRAGLYAALFFLGGVTAAVSHIAYFLGPNAYFLLNFFPVESAYVQAVMTESLEHAGVLQLGGFLGASLAVYSFTLLRYGVRGLLDMRRPWRMGLVLLAFAFGSLSGFRSFIILFFLVFALLFIIEKLHRTRWLWIFIAVGLIFGAILVSVSSKLPLPMQRALSFLPVEVSPVAKQAANASWEWRIEMWKRMIPDLPQYFWKGRGYALDPREMLLMQESNRRGFAFSAEGAALAGDYHNGPLSVFVPFGIWGVIGFGWFLIAAGRVLYFNHRFGSPALQRINTFLFALFVGRVIFFIFFFGSLYSELFLFTGLAGLSVSLNGGVSRPAVQETGETIESTLTPKQYALG